MDVRAKNLTLLRSERWGEIFWAGTSTRTSARTSAGYPTQKCYQGKLFKFNRCTKRPLQDSAIIFSTPGMPESAFYCANHRVSCKCQQPPGWKIHGFFRWKMPFAVFRSGSGVSELCLGCFPALEKWQKSEDFKNFHPKGSQPQTTALRFRITEKGGWD